MKVILHSDDLGLSPGVTRGILEALEAGVLHGTSVMATGEPLAPLAQRLAHLPQPPRLSVHLNLSEGTPVASLREVPWLVGPDGRLRLSFGRCLAGLVFCSPARRRARCAQIEREWLAQTRAVAHALAPLPIAAIDGHTHIHMLPFVVPIAAAVAAREGIGAIRVPREPLAHAVSAADWFRPAWWINQLKRLVLLGLARGREADARRLGLETPDAVTGVLYTGMMSRRAILAAVRAARRRGCRSLEVVLHVGPSAGPFPPAGRSTTAGRLRGLERSGTLQRASVA
ncbi:MAG: ChbG/HpnK family deacetylase [Vicinamibacterales bacterium]